MSSELAPDPGSSPPAGLLVRVRFETSDERAARELAAKLIDRAHELANLPQCECDVDASVEWIPPRIPPS